MGVKREDADVPLRERETLAIFKEARELVDALNQPKKNELPTGFVHVNQLRVKHAHELLDELQRRLTK